jgi:hypothetical protein
VLLGAGLLLVGIGFQFSAGMIFAGMIPAVAALACFLAGKVLLDARARKHPQTLYFLYAAGNAAYARLSVGGRGYSFANSGGTSQPYSPY